jgi:Holliday junction resolvase RusA-like endonuclease
MKIVIPGMPVPQARMKHSNKRGFVTTYDPKAKEKEAIRWHIRNEFSSDLNRLESSPIEYPRVTFLFHMPIPSSIRKKDQDFYTSGKMKHDKKPDIDNLIKLYLDCLDGLLIHGDQKVSLGPCLKVYHPDPKTIVWIHETTQKLNPWELDVAFLDGVEPSIPCFYEQDYPYGSESLWFQVRTLFHRNLHPDDAFPPSGSLGFAHLALEGEDKVSQMNELLF